MLLYKGDFRVTRLKNRIFRLSRGVPYVLFMNPGDDVDIFRLAGVHVGLLLCNLSYEMFTLLEIFR